MTKLHNASRECNGAARAIARLEPHQWPGLVLLILEKLDCEDVPDSAFRAGLLQIRRGIDERLDGGRW